MIGFALFPLIVRYDPGEEAGAVVLIYELRWSWQKRLMRGAKRWSGKCAVQFIQMGEEPPVRIGVFWTNPRGRDRVAAGGGRSGDAVSPTA